MERDTILSLEEALNTPPQVEQLLKIFQQDASVLNGYATSLLKACNRVAAAYNEVLLANKQLSQTMKQFANLGFAIDNGNKMIGEVFSHFSTHLDELSSHTHLMASQISDSVIYPLTKLVEADLQEVIIVGEHFNSAHIEHDEALAKYMRLSKRRSLTDEKAKFSHAQEVYSTRKRLHKTALIYFSTLNLLQYKRATELLESGLNYITTQKLFAASTNESFTASGVDDLIQAVLATTKNVSEALTADMESSATKISALEKENDALCYPEPISDDPPNVPDFTSTQKMGFLFYRSRSLLLTHWTRCFVSVQPPSGHLLIQHPGETAASVLLDLTEGDVYASCGDVDDRRFVIEVVAKKSKKQVYLQAENQIDRDEWIAVLNNVSGAGATMQPSPPSSPVRPVSPEKNPSLFSQIRNFVEGSASKGAIEESTECPPMLEAPIQFDLSSPSEEFPPLPTWLGLGAKSPSAGRKNPFGEGGPNTEDVTQGMEQVSVDDTNATSSFAHTYPLRFVGSVRIEPMGDHVTDHLVCDTMQQILAARALHGIFRMSELNMLVAADGIYLLDHSNATIKGRFPLHRVVHASSHNENDKLFAFVTCSLDSSNELTCHVFESDANAKSIVDTIHLIDQMTGEISTSAILSSVAEMQSNVEEGDQEPTEEDGTPQRPEEDTG